MNILVEAQLVVGMAGKSGLPCILACDARLYTGPVSNIEAHQRAVHQHMQFVI